MDRPKRKNIRLSEYDYDSPEMFLTLILHCRTAGTSVPTISALTRRTLP